jgi:hypothetical protein
MSNIKLTTIEVCLRQKMLQLLYEDQPVNAV